MYLNRYSLFIIRVGQDSIMMDSLIITVEKRKRKSEKFIIIAIVVVALVG